MSALRQLLKRLNIGRSLALLVMVPLFITACGGSDSEPPPPAPVPSPDTVSLTAVPDGFVIEWSAAAGVDSYNLYRSTTSGVSPSNTTLLKAAATSPYTDLSVATGEKYYYVVTSVLGGRMSAASTEVSGRFVPSPDTVSLTTSVDGFVIEWTAVPGAESYNLYRSTTPNVTPSSATLLQAGAVAPYTDRNVVTGQTYYYVVASVLGDGMSAASAEVGATFAVTDPATVPQNVSVIATPEVPNSLTIQWDSVAGAASYNLYWSTTAGVTPATGTKIADVTSPYIHGGLIGGTTYYYVVTAVIGGIERSPSTEVSGAPRGGRKPGGGETSFGNNLSVPVVFADGYGLAGGKIDGTVLPHEDFATGLRPLATELKTTFPYFDPASAYAKGGATYYPQGTASFWQADWSNGAAQPQHVTIDWGDQLRSRTPSVNSSVRIEANLYQNIADAADYMTAYSMTSLYGTQRAEVFGTDTTTFESSRRLVFAINARLKIEKLLAQGGAVDPSIPPIIDQAVYEGFGAEEGGGGRFGAEVTGSGGLTYGYILLPSNLGLTTAQLAGWWRVTFSLDDIATVGGVDVPNNTFIDAVDPADTTATVVSPTVSVLEFQMQ